MQYRNKHTHKNYMHAQITDWNTHTHTHLSVWVCWFGVSDRVWGISLITWDEEVERYGQHVKDGLPLSWSSPPRPILLFPKFLQLGRADVGSVHRSPTVITFITEGRDRTGKDRGTGSAEFLKNLSQMKLHGALEVVSTLWAPVSVKVVLCGLLLCFYVKSLWFSLLATLQPATAY